MWSRAALFVGYQTCAVLRCAPFACLSPGLKYDAWGVLHPLLGDPDCFIKPKHRQQQQARSAARPTTFVHPFDHHRICRTNAHGSRRPPNLAPSASSGQRSPHNGSGTLVRPCTTARFQGELTVIRLEVFALTQGSITRCLHGQEALEQGAGKDACSFRHGFRRFHRWLTSRDCSGESDCSAVSRSNPSCTQPDTAVMDVGRGNMIACVLVLALCATTDARPDPTGASVGHAPRSNDVSA